MADTNTYTKLKCYHCGDDCNTDVIVKEDKNFCCEGCKLVYELLEENNLCNYYSIDENPGVSLKSKVSESKFNYLDEADIADKLIEYKDGQIAKVSFYIPNIHCSSCIWLLENLHKLEAAVVNTRVDFLKKTVTITYKPDAISLKYLAVLLASIGYEPLINLEQAQEKINDLTSKELLKKVAVAGFCFGNIMLFSFPEYFGFDTQSETAFKNIFGYLNIVLVLPVLLYSGFDYLKAAYKAISHKLIHIDVPIALGMVALFLRSVYEIVSHTGAGYMDSLSGLIFFLLVGKWFQNKTFERISFERDYKSYFPLAATLIKNGIEKPIAIDKLKVGDKIVVRNGELIPADAILLKGNAHIDFSFVTGESLPQTKVVGEMLYAGGRQVGEAIEMEVMKDVSQSYLTRLWNDEAFDKETIVSINSIADRVSKYFTVILLILATGTLAYWVGTDVAKAFQAFTAVLIIACPCALALSTPFTLGNVLRIFGKNKFYLKNADVVEKLANVDNVVFDKTGTLTEANNNQADFIGEELSQEEKDLVYNIAKQSTHPLSQSITNTYQRNTNLPIENFKETIGKGIEASVNDNQIKLGSYTFINNTTHYENTQKTVQHSFVYLSINAEVKGYFKVKNTYRKGLKEVISKLSKNNTLYVLSGDNDGEKYRLKAILGNSSNLFFNQSPTDKLTFIKNLQAQGNQVLTVGDGLNDAGALKKSNVGIVLSENINNFSPASDAVLDASNFTQLPKYKGFAKSAMKVIYAAFTISFLYNIVGLSFAVQGSLSPVVAAILMPVSSISVVLFSTVATNYLAKKGGML